MNYTTKLIKDLEQQNLTKETHRLKQKIVNEIENIIKLYQYHKGFILSESQKVKSRILLAETMLRKAENLFNPIICTIIMGIINELKQE